MEGVFGILILCTNCALVSLRPHFGLAFPPRLLNSSDLVSCQLDADALGKRGLRDDRLYCCKNNNFHSSQVYARIDA